MEVKRERPEVLNSSTVKVPTGLGNLYITISELDGQPFEVFCTLGKSGKDVSAKAEVTGRMVSLALRYNVPIEEIVSQLIDISGESLMPWKDTVIKSIPDAVGKILKWRYIDAIRLETRT